MWARRSLCVLVICVMVVVKQVELCAQTAFELEPDCNVVRQAGERVQGKPRRKEQNTRAPVFEPEPNTRPCLGSSNVQRVSGKRAVVERRSRLKGG